MTPEPDADPPRTPVTSPEIDEFFTSEHPRLVNIAWKRLGNRQDAEEAAAEVMAQMWWRWPQIDNHRAYAHTALVNEIKRMRGGAYARLCDLTSPDRVEESVAAAPEADLYEERQVVEQHLVHLPPAQRDVIRERVVNDLDYKQIAAKLGKTEPAVRQNAAQGVKKLRARIPRPASAQEPEAADTETERRETR
ncbi:sigma-70 family RNA polymerase sigma factor [Actinoplanes sp. NPDC049118]|uniref:RNA polymerase sigma factor n=1 Tax=Actinoplanes sp. NPDC049118 TaxID=3155769 RepID=UPI0033C3A39D